MTNDRQLTRLTAQTVVDVMKIISSLLLSLALSLLIVAVECSLALRLTRITFIITPPLHPLPLRLAARSVIVVYSISIITILLPQPSSHTIYSTFALRLALLLLRWWMILDDAASNTTATTIQ